MPKVQQLRNDIAKMGTGYGLMSMTWKETPVPQAQAFEAMYKAVELARANGSKAFFNVGEFYGNERVNLTYIKDFFAKYPELRNEVIVSCKGGMDCATLAPKGKADDVRASVEASVLAMGGFIDIFEVARLDTGIMLEGEMYPKESFIALAELIENGLIGGISLSEVNEAQIRAIHNDWAKYITCVEVELSLFSTQILHNNIAKTCGELGLTIICYSPLGRGLLTGRIQNASDIPAGDFRLLLKRFQGDAMQQNLLLTKFLHEEIVAKRDASHPLTLAQLALGWIKHWNGQKEFNAKFIPIPSGSSITKVSENFDESRTKITDAEFEKINEFLKGFSTQGDRYEMV